MLEYSPFLMAKRTAFVGRESESSAIRAVIDRASAGIGSILMLFDGPGVGKTRLAMEMAEYVAQGLPLLHRALESYERIGMPRHVGMTQRLLDRAASR